MMEKAIKKVIAITAGDMSHTLHTPLAAIKMGARGINSFLPDLIDAYQKAKQVGLSVIDISPEHMEILKDTLENIESDADSITQYIDGLCYELNTLADRQKEVAPFDIKECLQEAERNARCFSGEQIQYDGNDTFTLVSNKDYLNSAFYLLFQVIWLLAEDRQKIPVVTVSLNKTENAIQVVFLFRPSKHNNEKALADFFINSDKQRYHRIPLKLFCCAQIVNKMGGSLEYKCDNASAKFVSEFSG